MANFFNSQASNYLVATAVKVSKVEKSIAKRYDSTALVELYNSIQDGTKIIEEAIEKIEKKLMEGCAKDERGL